MCDYTPVNIPLHVIVAVTPSYGIGFQGKLPWNAQGLYFHKDMQHFKETTCQTKHSTKQNAVIMGKNTWLSLPTQYVPLSNRVNVVLTRNTEWANTHLTPLGVLHATSLENALELLNSETYKDAVESAFVIGGTQLFEEAIIHPQCNTLFMTTICLDLPCDTFLTNMTITKIMSMNPVQTREEMEKDVSMRIDVFYLICSPT